MSGIRTPDDGRVEQLEPGVYRPSRLLRIAHMSSVYHPYPFPKPFDAMLSILPRLFPLFVTCVYVSALR